MPDILHPRISPKTSPCARGDHDFVGCYAAASLLSLGVFGIIIVCKLYERHQLYKSTADACLQEASQSAFDLLKSAEKLHNKEHRFRSFLQLYQVRLILHAFIAVVGFYFYFIEK